MAFMGMRGTDDWVANQRPENWREQILYLYPNGQAPLTAMLSMLASESTDDPHFHWWTENVGSVGGDIDNIYTSADLAVAYVGGGVTGLALYVVVALALAQQIRAGHQLLLRDTDDYRVDVNVIVTSDPLFDGAASVLTIRLLEDDDNAPATADLAAHDLSDADNLLVIGNINPEGGEIPTAVHQDPTEFESYTQIFRTALDVTRTASKTKLRTGDDYQRMKRDALEAHSIEMEQNTFWSILTQNVGANGKPQRTTQGIIPFVRQYAPTNVDDYRLNATYTGLTWLQGGEEWMDDRLERLFRYGSNEKMAFIGSGALLGINRLAKSGGQINLTPETVAYGMKVRRWITPFGDLLVKTHPLFSFQATTRNMMVILEPRNMRMRYIDDTFFKKDTSEREGGHNAIDGRKEEFLTEMGFEFHHPLTFGIMNGLNELNIVAP